MSEAFSGDIAGAIDAVKARMAAACARAGRDPASVTLLAVTKFHPAEAVLEAYAAGVRHFGENRVQEAEAKFTPILASLAGASVHLLGHLQGNKVKKAVALFNCVQSVDSEALLAELARRARDAGRRLDLLLELHTGEESKSGFPDEAAVLRALELADAMPELCVRGLMTMAPYTDDVDVVRASFRSCAALYHKARSNHKPEDFNILSMGMTNDFETAIEEGSTMVRVGTAIFGSRVYP